MQGLRDHFKRGVFWNGVSVSGNLFTHFLGALILGWLLTSTEEFRLIGILLTLMNLSFLLSEFGLSTAIVQAETLKRVQLNTVFTVNFGIGLAQTLLFCVTAPLMAMIFRSPELVPYMLAISLIFVTLSAGLVHKGLLARAVNFRALALAETLGYVVYLAVLATLAWRGYGVWAFVWAKLLEQLVETACICLAGRFIPNIRDFSFNEIRSMFRFGLNMTGAQVVAFFIGNLDVFLVGIMLPKETGGIYLYARKIVVVPAVRMLRLVTRVSVPVLSRMQDNLKRMTRSYCLMNKLLALLSFPAFLGLALVSKEMVHALLPATLNDIIPMVQVLAIGSSFNLLASLTIVVFYSLARADILMRFQLLVLAFRFALMYLVLRYTQSALMLCWALLFERLFFTALFQQKAFAVMGARTLMLLRHLATPALAAGSMVAVVFPLSFFGARFCDTQLQWGILLAIEILAGAGVYIGVSLGMDRQILEEARTFFTKPQKAPPLEPTAPAEGC